MKKFSLLILIAISLSCFSCQSQFEVLKQSNDIDLKYDAAFKYFNAEKYRKSADLFESLYLACEGTLRGDTVQFYQGLSNYKFGDFITAEANFDKFIQIYPRSPFTVEAKFLRIECLYDATYRYELDQVPTQRALLIINEYIYENPDSKYLDASREMIDDLNERLDRKAFESAKLYYKLDDYKAAAYALKNVLKDNADNQYREEIKLYIALSSFSYADNSVSSKQKERFMLFIDDYYSFISEYPESREKDKLEGMFKNAQEYTINK